MPQTISIDTVWLQYVCDQYDDHTETAEQNLMDVPEVGTLICPECGDDMALEIMAQVRS